MATDAQRMTIDELAHRSGTAASTIRLYQTKGVLPPPQREGRVGYYGEGHLARLRLIAQLQEEGFSLASIGRLVDAWEHGRGLDDVLGLEAQLATIWGADEPLLLRPAELAQWLPEESLTPELVQRGVELGLLEFDGDRIVVLNPRFLEIGSELVRLGIPATEILDELAALMEVTDTIAARFTQIFERHFWAPLVEGGLSADDVKRLTDVLGRLSVSAESVLTVALRRSLKSAAAAFLAEQAKQLADAGALEVVEPFAAAAGLDLGA